MMSFADGNRYAGEWRSGNKHGVGVFAFPDGEEYRGAYADNSMHGRGVYLFVNGDMYEGDYEFDAFHGTALGCACVRVEKQCGALRLWLHGTARARMPFRRCARFVSTLFHPATRAQRLFLIPLLGAMSLFARPRRGPLHVGGRP
jgi:hypothetical protein